MSHARCWVHPYPLLRDDPVDADSHHWHHKQLHRFLQRTQVTEPEDIEDSSDDSDSDRESSVFSQECSPSVVRESSLVQSCRHPSTSPPAPW